MNEDRTNTVDPNYASPRYLKRIFLLLLLFLAVGSWSYYRSTHHIKIPEHLLLEDFQTPLDRELSANLSEWENTMLGRFIRDQMLGPYIDALQLGQLSLQGVEFRPDQFRSRSDLHRIVQECSQILFGTNNAPAIYIVNCSELNARTINFKYPAIIINSELLETFTDERELRFIIGHEMGHIRCGHVKWTGLLTSILKAANIVMKVPLGKDALIMLLPILKWSREAEKSADNAGLICCQDLSSAEQALARLAHGMNEQIIGKVDINMLASQSQTMDTNKFAEVILYWLEMQQEHPFIPYRIKHLRDYEKTANYRHLWK